MSTENSREGWSSVRLGDAVIRTSKRCTPDLSDSVRWVGADHIDEGDLAVRRWSTTDDPMFPPTFCFGVPSGSVLLHSRNPKKVAILPFDAITGEKLFCLSPADKATLDSRFLAYQLQSDHFHEFVGRWLSGSVNKFLNWTALERYEFALPPIAEQRQIAGVLTMADSVTELVAGTLQVCEDLERSVVTERVWGGGYQNRPIRDVLSGSQFFDGDWIESKDQAPAGVRLLQLADIGVGRFLDMSSRYVSEETFERLRCSEVLPGDWLVSRMADPIGRTCIVPDLGQRLITVVDACVIRPQTMTTTEHSYWLAILNSPEWTRACERAAGGSTRTRVSRSKLEALRVPDLGIAERLEVAATLDRIARFRNVLRQKEASSRALVHVLREVCFGGGAVVY